MPRRSASATGIVRYALEQNPNLRIATLVFGARNGSFLSAVPSIDSEKPSTANFVEQ